MEAELGSAFIQAVSLRTKACNGVLAGFYTGGYACGHIFECAKSSLGARLVTAKSLNEVFVLKGLAS